MTRVLHTADTHIGYRQYHSPERQVDFLDAFRRVVADAVESDVDAVVHAGDLFHDRRPDLSDLLGTLDVLETLSDADIPFLAVVGNHETKRSAQWLDLFEAMGLATRLGDEPVVVGETAFYGLDFVPRAQRADLDYEFESHEAESAALVSHGRFEPLVPDYGSVEWDVAEILDSASAEFDAVLLGDEHVPTTQEVSDVWVTYPGSTERASAGEREERGYNLVEFEGDGDVRISRRGLETRPFVFVDLELGEHEGIERVRDRLREHDLEDAVVHVSLEGDGESVSPASIESFATDEGALVARVKDRRELADEAVDADVSFADPDEAVRERLREIELSDAARDLDETIRSATIADSNVASEVERRVEELLADPDSLGGSQGEAASDSASESAAGSTSDSRLSASESDSDHPSVSETDSAPVSSPEADASRPESDDSSDGQSSMGEYL
ncbi:MAG: DNA double-strand break repair protein Mre11 [Natronomonas sp.]|uniref:DNA double-strand break repair protein Mre11 n=1 Tax=Natronomonas sp. TaxID=2184060 RepID=UPI002870620C|nr:DNA double-strand break repair protein Mre11 [Natronomonas sp.]MDR9430599.1 DNA double-strand break repair protein Mre11 [Natronomonas sp.]